MSENAPIAELKALAHPLRFQILQVLKSRELNVGEIEQATGIGQPALSQQLSVLRKAELVETRKEAKLVYYSLAAERLSKLAALIGNPDAGQDAPARQTRQPAPGVANFARLS
ncbi:metalloregulator ArsR/SmtB family transcription factor [Erythrobacter aquimaris]|uniref:Metalloregulator ArsR/SmtB family transcription factor n=1 Tax=Qipengyuania aquimaris TaxID=255984 RepID=A0A6I4TN19_9SPHN|nr:metalloregulator ArsR/SmtB family transcription factor [Qipengyuania aquimaris]MXO96590.1 metalloregulator ArsR/SmtB family transcription factor [Qipengyuania aquimaris]